MATSIKKKIRNGELPKDGYTLVESDVGALLDKEFGRVMKKHVGFRVHVMSEGGIYLSKEIGGE